MNKLTDKLTIFKNNNIINNILKHLQVDSSKGQNTSHQSN